MYPRPPTSFSYLDSFIEALIKIAILDNFNIHWEVLNLNFNLLLKTPSPFEKFWFWRLVKLHISPPLICKWLGRNLYATFKCSLKFGHRHFPSYISNKSFKVFFFTFFSKFFNQFCWGFNNNALYSIDIAI